MDFFWKFLVVVDGGDDSYVVSGLFCWLFEYGVVVLMLVFEVIV